MAVLPMYSRKSSASLHFSLVSASDFGPFFAVCPSAIPLIMTVYRRSCVLMKSSQSMFLALAWAGVKPVARSTGARFATRRREIGTGCLFKITDRHDSRIMAGNSQGHGAAFVAALPEKHMPIAIP